MLISVGMLGCAIENTDGVRGKKRMLKRVACPSVSVPTDQRDSFFNYEGNNYPIRISFDPKFTESEKQRLLNAIDDWNDVSRERFGKRIFEIEAKFDREVLASYDVQGCATFPLAEKKQNSLEIVKVDASDPKIDRNPGMIHTCTQRESVTRQIIFINSNMNYLNRIEHIGAHELGHAIGADHSCNSKRPHSEGYVSCDSLPKAHPYRILAVMFPTLEVDGQILFKDKLSENDRVRGTCLMNEQWGFAQ